MTPQAGRVLRRAGWSFVASFFLTPTVMWILVVRILGRDPAFPEDLLDFYRALFSLDPEGLVPWLILLAPVVLCELLVACCHYLRHPEEVRWIFRFPGRRR